jgi:hypothetical protein
MTMMTAVATVPTLTYPIEAFANSQAVTSETWDDALASYRYCRALMEANEKFGPYHAAMENFDHERDRISKEYGGWQRARSTPDGKKQADRAWEACNAAEKEYSAEYLEPVWAAARKLVSTPAPDLAALRIKIEVIDREEVWNDAQFAGDTWDIVNEDAARLQSARQ